MKIIAENERQQKLFAQALEEKDTELDLARKDFETEKGWSFQFKVVNFIKFAIDKKTKKGRSDRHFKIYKKYI